MAKRFLTLDIGASTVALAEYAGGKDALTLVNYGTAALAAPLDAGNAATILVPAVMEVVREKGIKPGPVAVSVSGQMVFPRLAAIPAAGGEEKFEHLVRAEIEQNVPFPIDEMVWDRQVLGDTEAGDKSVLLVAAKVEQIEGVTDALVSAGFRPELVGAAPLAVTNVVRADDPTGAQCVIVLDIGAKTTSLVIAEGDKIYNRSIPIGGNNLTREIAQALGCSPEEAEQFKCERGYVATGGVTEDEDEQLDRVSKVCRAVFTRIHAEISRSVNFYRSQQGGSAPTKLYLTGGTALLAQTDAFFAESLGVEVEYLNPFERIAPSPSLNAEALSTDAAYLAPTAGLALQAAGAARFAVNLLPPALVAQRAEQAKIPVVVAAGVLFLAGLALCYLGASRARAVAEAERDAVSARSSELRGFSDKIAAAQKKTDAAAAEADALRDLIVARGAAEHRLMAVRAALVDGMWIERWEGNCVTIRGWKDRLDEAKARDVKHREVSEIVKDRLAATPGFGEGTVRIGTMTKLGKGDILEQFTLELKTK